MLSLLGGHETAASAECHVHNLQSPTDRCVHASRTRLRLSERWDNRGIDIAALAAKHNGPTDPRRLTRKRSCTERSSAAQPPSQSQVWIRCEGVPLTRFSDGVLARVSRPSHTKEATNYRHIKSWYNCKMAYKHYDGKVLVASTAEQSVITFLSPKPPSSSSLLSFSPSLQSKTMPETPASGTNLTPFRRYSQDWKKWKSAEAPTIDLLAHMYLEARQRSTGITLTQITLDGVGFDSRKWCAWLAQVIADELYAADGKVSHSCKKKNGIMLISPPHRLRSRSVFPWGFLDRRPRERDFFQDMFDLQQRISA